MAQSTSTTVFASPNKSSTSRASVADASNPPVQLLEEAAHRRVCCRCHDAHDLLLHPGTIRVSRCSLFCYVLFAFIVLFFFYDLTGFYFRHVAFLRMNHVENTWQLLWRRYLGAY